MSQGKFSCRPTTTKNRFVEIDKQLKACKSEYTKNGTRLTDLPAKPIITKFSLVCIYLLCGFIVKRFKTVKNDYHVLVIQC